MKQGAVFIADGSEAFCRELSQAVDRIPGLRVVGTAIDGEQTLRCLRERVVDLLVLDLMLPKKDGIAILKELSRQEDRPQVLTTAVFVSDFVAAAAAVLGGSYLVRKPCDPHGVAERLQEMWNGLPSFPAVPRSFDVDAVVTSVLQKLSIPAHTKGYKYLREAVIIAVEEMEVLSAITKELYPQVARRYGTTASNVERAIRHALELVWKRGEQEVLHGYFGSWHKLTNSESIALIADRVRLQTARHRRYGGD